jgi:hypothetical protein
MVTDLSFNHVIPTSLSAQPQFPPFIETVEQAIDCVQELPLATLKLDRWTLVSLALWSALDSRHDTVRLIAADQMLCAALNAEGWLGEQRLI